MKRDSLLMGIVALVVGAALVAIGAGMAIWADTTRCAETLVGAAFLNLPYCNDVPTIFNLGLGLFFGGMAGMPALAGIIFWFGREGKLN